MDYSCLGRESVTVDATADGVTLTPAKAAMRGNIIYAKIQIQTASVRATYNGSKPVANTTGDLWDSGDEIEIWGLDDIRAARFIREGASSGVLEVNYYGIKGG